MTPETSILRGVVGSGEDFGTFQVRSFVPADYVAVYEQIAQQPGGFTIADPWAAGRSYLALGPCFTAEVAWRPLGCAGLSLMSPGRAVAWALLSPALRTDRPARRWFKQQVRQRIPILMGEHGVRRLEADVTAGGLTFVRSLGFAVESVMPLWGPNGETFFKFVRFHPSRWDEVG